MLVDSHCHLDFDEFAHDLDPVMQRAAEADIGAFVTISIRVREFDRVRAVIEHHADVYGSIGTHPHYADEERHVTAEQLVRLAQHPKIVAIGETGLDRWFGHASWEAQLECFQTHIDAARQSGLPLVIHSVREDEAMREILQGETARGAFGVVMHCFSGGPELAQTSLSLGHYISFSGLLTYPEHDALREIARHVPADRLLVETDAPSLAPVPIQDQRNEPAHIHHVVRLLAELRGVGTRDIERQTTENFYRAFRHCPPPAHRTLA